MSATAPSDTSSQHGVALAYGLDNHSLFAAAGAPDAEVEVAIVGAGPVGLLLAHLLARKGIRTVLLEKRLEPRRHSMAIGITPPSLDILETIGLAAAFRQAGLPIREAEVYESGALSGRLTFAQLDGAHPFILSIPQSKTEELLSASLRDQSIVQRWNGCAAEAIQLDRDCVRLVAREVASGRALAIRARFVVACDGAHSALRAAGGIGARRKTYAPMFVLSDYIDTTSLGDRACLYFDPERPVESFPLPGGQRRWIIRTGWRDRTDLVEPFEQTVARLTGHRLPPAACIWRSDFRPIRLEARRYYRGRLILCGDAAHAMSPIGGQGMNTGFADAAHLAVSLHAMLRDQQDAQVCLKDYEARRRAAYRRAADRAALGMWLGTRSGRLASRARAALVAALLRNPQTQFQLALWFSMRSLPQPLRIENPT